PLKVASESIRGCANVPNGREPFSNGQALPVTIGFRLLLFRFCDSANCLVCTQSSRSPVRRRTKVRERFCVLPSHYYSLPRCFASDHKLCLRLCCATVHALWWVYLMVRPPIPC